jgi:hypothetical protein
MHFRLLVSLGVKGSEAIEPPQVAHCQSPVIRGFSPVAGTESKPSSICGPAAGSASNGMSGTSVAVDIAGAVGVFPPFDFIKHERQVRPVSLLGINGSSVIVPPQPLHFQFP